jgi:hypothetical protein
MKIQLTIRLTPESRGEMIDKFGAQYRDYREQLEAAVQQGAFGPPDKVNVRWLLSSGRWE